jgi:sulfur-oxidizing protein SoxX
MGPWHGTACGLGVWLAIASALAAGAVPGGLPEPLTARPGDAEAGRALVADRQRSLCLLCHQGPFAHPQLQGTVAGNLAGAGARWSVAQLRQRIVDSRPLDPDGLMPAFHRTSGLQQVGSAWSGRPILDAQQVEDVVAFLATLK